MAVHGETENFIPFRVWDLVEHAAGENRLEKEDAERFRALARIVSALYHHEFHARLQRIKAAFAPLDPDADTREVEAIDDAERAAGVDVLVDEFRQVLLQANYTPVTTEEVETALREHSLIPFDLKVDLGDFEDVLLFSRGGHTAHVEVQKGFVPFLKKTEDLPVDTYERVVMLLRYKEASHFEAQKRRLEKLPFVPGKLYIQLFKNIPKADVESLFPNVRVGMSWRHKVMFLVPAIGVGIPVLLKVAVSVTALITAIAIFLGVRKGGNAAAMAGATAGLAGLMALFGYFFRQYATYKSKMARFLKEVTEQLFFKNLDSNAGVFRTLVDEAEEEETKEAILAYYHLLVDGPATESDLDRRVEDWFERTLDLKLDFEVDDALGKLERLGLVSKDPDGRFTPATLPDALVTVDRTWDSLYEYA